MFSFECSLKIHRALGLTSKPPIASPRKRNKNKNRLLNINPKSKIQDSNHIPSFSFRKWEDKAVIYLGTLEHSLGEVIIILIFSCYVFFTF